MSVPDDFGVTKDTRIDSKDRVDLDNADSLYNHREGDSVLEDVLWKIELIHSEVHRVKTQVDLVMFKNNAARFSSQENLSRLAASSAPSPTVSAGGGVIYIESTVGLFADANVTLHHIPQVGDSCEDILDNILIRNGVAEEMNADLMESSSREGEGTSVLPLQQLQETEHFSLLVLKILYFCPSFTWVPFFQIVCLQNM